MEKRIFKHILVLSLLVGLLLTAMVQGQSAFDIRWGQQQTYSDTPANTLKQWAEGIDGRVSGGAVGTGKIWYVDSNVSSAGSGTSWTSAYATVDEAINKVSADAGASRGDVIKVAEGHAESGIVADLFDADVAGITIKGMGSGSLMPTFTFAHADTTIAVGAANVTFKNLRFVAGITSITMGISIEAGGDNFAMIGCIFPKPTTAGWEFLDSIDVADGGNDILIYGCEAYNDEAGAAPAHFIDAGNGTAGPTRLQIVSCIIKGDFSVSAIWSDEPCDEAYIAYNTITNHTSGQHCIEFTDAGTGAIAFNSLFTDAEGTALDPGSMSCFENYVTTAVDVSGMIVPVHDTGTTQLNATTISAIASGVTGLGFRGTATNNAVTTTVISADMLGFGNDYFNTGWSIICILDADGVGTAPEGEVRDITDYVSSTGTFTVAAFTSALTTSDEIYIRRREELGVDFPTILGSSGTVWYLDDGGSGGDARSWQTAATTLAVVEALMSAGDTCYIGKGHTESITTGGDLLNVAYTSFIGIGTGNDKPLFTGDVDSDEITLNAAGVVLKNVRIRPGVTAATSGIRVESTAIGCVIEDVDIVDGEAAGTDEFTDAISVDTLAADLTIRNCTFYNTGAPGTFINLDEATIANTTITGCTFFGACTEAPIWGAAAVPTNLFIAGNTINNTSSGNMCIEFTGNATGQIRDNAMSGNTYGAIMDPGLCKLSGNTQNLGADTGAEDIPLIAGKTYARKMLLGDTNASQNLFSVTGSPIIVTSFLGKATVSVGGATVMKINCDADDTWDYDISTSVDIDTVDQGGLLTFTAAAGESVLAVQAVGGSGSMGVPIQWFVEEGMLESTLDSGGSTGNIEWYMIFSPVENGCEVIPQAGN